jgi:hypothetical protein
LGYNDTGFSKEVYRYKHLIKKIRAFLNEYPNDAPKGLRKMKTANPPNQ